MSRRALRALLPILASVAVLGGVTGAGAQTTSPAPVTTGTPEQKAAAITGPAVVYIEQSWRAWVRVPRASELIYFEGYVNDGYAFEWSTRCSGFVVNPNGYIFTAGHCVDKGEEGARGTALEFAVQWLIDQGYIYKRDFQYWLDEAHLLWGVEGQEKGSEPDLEIFVQRGIAAGGLQTGEAFPARLVDYSPWSEGDGALLKIEETDLPTLLVAPSTSIAIGTPILAVGYPGSTDAVTDASLEPTFKDGQVNAEKTREGGLLPVYEISAALSGGMSGGPTVDLNGDLVGVNSFGIVGETEAFNFITPGSIVTEMMAQNGVANELGPIDVAYREGVDAFFQGDYQTAIAKFDEVLALSPTHPQAQELKVEATKLATAAPSTPPPSAGGGEGTADEGGGFPVVAIVGIVVAVVIVGAVLFVLSRRRGAGTAAPAQAPPLQAVGAPPQPGAEAARSVGFQPTPTATPPQVTAPPPPAATPPPTPPPAEHVEARFCPNCGHALEADAHFCPSCGHKVGG
jgi:S1-C subfamily serine protease